jgi:histidinol-phosphate aminotransferase
MNNRANQNVLKIKPYVPGKPIDEVKRELGLKRVVKLASNENPYPPSPAVLKAVREAGRNLNRYPDGSCFELRQELSRRLKVDPRQLVFGCGSDEVIVLALRAFINPGDEVVMAVPSFLVYSLASTLAGARCIQIPLKGLRYDMSAMKKAVTARTKIVFIGNPDNPSGQFPDKAEVDSFLRGLAQDVLVFFDEAYYEFAAAEKNYVQTLDLLRSRGNVIVARTFSKLFGLAGLRIGYGVASLEVAALMDRVREPFNVTSVAQAAALAALKDRVYYDRILKELNTERSRLCAQLRSFSAQGVEVSKGCTNFIQIRTSKDSRELSAALLKKGIIVRDMSAWGLSNYIRVTIGKPSENRLFLKAFAAAI